MAPYMTPLVFWFFSGSSGFVVLIIFIIIFVCGTIAVILLYYKRRVATLKTEILAVQYSADPQGTTTSYPERHHFDNPVYAFQSPAAAAQDNTKLLNNFVRPSNFHQNQFNVNNGGPGSSNGSVVGGRAAAYALNINSDLNQKNFNADQTNPILYNGSDDGAYNIDHVYDEIKYKDESKDIGNIW